MADITKLTTVGVDGLSAQRCVILSGDIFAGEVITSGAAVFVHTDGLVMNAVQASGSAGAMAKFDGMVDRAYTAGQSVTVFGAGAILGYAGATLTPGAYLYPSATKGKIGDAIVSTNDKPVAKAITASDILVLWV
jgi:hypothetical protein